MFFKNNETARKTTEVELKPLNKYISYHRADSTMNKNYIAAASKTGRWVDNDLFAATLNQDHKEIKRLIEEEGASVNAVQLGGEYTALELAVLYQSVDCVAILLKYGANQTSRIYKCLEYKNNDLNYLSTNEYQRCAAIKKRILKLLEGSISPDEHLVDVAQNKQLPFELTTSPIEEINDALNQLTISYKQMADIMLSEQALNFFQTNPQILRHIIDNIYLYKDGYNTKELVKILMKYESYLCKETMLANAVLEYCGNRLTDDFAHRPVLNPAFEAANFLEALFNNFQNLESDDRKELLDLIRDGYITSANNLLIKKTLENNSYKLK